MDNSGIKYHSIGVNGASVPSYLRCDYLMDQLKLVKPDLVIFPLELMMLMNLRLAQKSITKIMIL